MSQKKKKKNNNNNNQAFIIFAHWAQIRCQSEFFGAAFFSFVVFFQSLPFIVLVAFSFVRFLAYAVPSLSHAHSEYYRFMLNMDFRKRQPRKYVKHIFIEHPIRC